MNRPVHLTKQHFDLVVAGGGSGGLGAAISAARLGLKVLLVEKADSLGGTATRGGVHTWEPVCGATGLPYEIYQRLKLRPQAVGIYSYGRHVCWPRDGDDPFPGGEALIDPTRRYHDTLQRHGPKSLGEDETGFRERKHGVTFEPSAYGEVVEELLRESGRCTVMLESALVGAETKNGVVKSVLLQDGRVIEADAFIDSTADAWLCAACGCELMRGRDPRSRFGEPAAPEAPTDQVNGVSLIYRVTPVDEPAVEPLPPDIPANCWWTKRFPNVFVTQYPGGDRNFNPLPTMEGAEFLNLSYESAYRECRRRITSHWHWVQTEFPEFQNYRRVWVAPGLGVRESVRVLGEYVLTEHDVLGGLERQEHPDIITLADHALDTHGSGSKGCGEVEQPYGVPFRCLVPQGYRNLLVACRAASFSSLAASSCRLSRTMMQLGQAAGTAVAVAKQSSVAPSEVAPDLLRRALRLQHVQLEHPLPEPLRRYLADEDVLRGRYD